MAAKRHKALSDQPLPPLLSLPDATFQLVFSFLGHIDVLQPAEFDVRAYRQRLASSLLVCRAFATTTQRLITEADAAKLANTDPITTRERFFQSFPRLQRLNVHWYTSLSPKLLRNVDWILEAASTRCVHVQALSFIGFQNFQQWHAHNGGLRVMALHIPCATSFFHDLARYCPDLTYVISNGTCASIPSMLSSPKLRDWRWLRLETKSVLRDFASTLRPHVTSVAVGLTRSSDLELLGPNDEFDDLFRSVPNLQNILCFSSDSDRSAFTASIGKHCEILREFKQVRSRQDNEINRGAPEDTCCALLSACRAIHSIHLDQVSTTDQTMIKVIQAMEGRKVSVYIGDCGAPTTAACSALEHLATSSPRIVGNLHLGKTAAEHNVGGREMRYPWYLTVSRLSKLLFKIPKVEVTTWNNFTCTGPREVSVRSTDYSARIVFQYRESPNGVHHENSHRHDPIEITSFRLSSALPRSSGPSSALELRERVNGLQVGHVWS